jgi:uncharacterized coiled-coil DUF342 family protein
LCDDDEIRSTSKGLKGLVLSLLTKIDELFDQNKTLLARIDELHQQNKALLERIAESAPASSRSSPTYTAARW